MMGKDPEGQIVWILADLRVHPGERSVVRDGSTIDLPRLSFDLLLALIHAAPEALSTDELMTRVWKGAVVSPATVAKRVELLRQALGDDSTDPRYVAVLRGYGYRLVPGPRRAVSGSTAVVGQARRGFRWRAGLLVLAALTALTITALMLLRPAQDASPPGQSIAVLPFRSLTEDPQDQQFADGLAEEIGYALARLGTLRVAGQSSSSRFRESDAGPVSIGKTLGVAYLLEGTVRRSGERLRVVTQLTGTDDGMQRWSDTWEGTMDDVLTVHQVIASRVVDQLELVLSRGGERDDVPRTDNAEAFALYLKAKSLMHYPGGSDLSRAQVLLEQAVSLDPDFAEAWAHLGVAHLRRTLWNEPGYALTPEESVSAARDSIDRALAADPGVGFAYAGLAGIAWAFEDDIAKAARMTEQFARFASWELSMYSFAADLYTSLGRPEQARRLQAYVLERDPLCAYCRVAFIGTLNATGDHDAASQQARLLLINEPEIDLHVYHLGRSLLMDRRAGEALATFERIGNESLRLSGLAMASHTLGRNSDATRYWNRLESIYPGPAGALIQAQAASWLGHDARALELLNVWIERPDWRISFQVQYLDPMFEGLHDTLGWERLLERINRAPAQIRSIEFDVVPYLDLEE
jgi:TolB-like protein/DNA-binding winged helix-turn-helix (wHTH) protein